VHSKWRGSHIWQRAHSRKRTHLLEEVARLGEGCTRWKKDLCERGAPKAKGRLCWSLDKRRAHQREGAHMSKNFTKHHKVSSRGAHLQVGKGRAQRKYAKVLARKEGRTKAKGTFVQGLACTSSRDSKASEFGCYCTRFSYICFPYCTHALSCPNNTSISKLVLLGGVLSRVMLTKNTCVQISCMLSV
jgi:hypothetical protein